MNRKFYITTTLPYVNADPHLGFALEIIQAVREVNAGSSAMDAAILQKVMARFSNVDSEPLVQELTPRELEVLTLVAKGFTNKAIGVQLHISDRTVQGHLAHIFDKLQAASRTEAVMRAVSLGWISPSLDATDTA
jgi:DNA-binding NarL/FixJ family response regulator